MRRAESRNGAVVGALVLAWLTSACADGPATPVAPSPVLSRGDAPQGGAPPNVPLPPVSAIGATRFMAFGDSITCGTLSSFDGSMLFHSNCQTGYPSNLDGLLEVSYSLQDFTVHNQGVPGEQAGDAVSTGRFSQAISTERPQGLLLLEGINDLNNGRSISATVGSLQQLIELARLYNTTVLIATMFQTCVSVSPTGVVRQNSADLIVPFNAAIRSMAAGRQNVYVVDLYPVFGNNCGPDGGVALLGGDGLHPSPDGYTVMASAFAQAIRDRFAVRGSFQ